MAVSKGKELTIADSHALVVGMEERIQAALPRHIHATSFVSVLKDAMSRNPKLRQCTDISLRSSLMLAAEFGLVPNTPQGLCYLIPYWNGKAQAMEAQFQFGYRGIVELAIRTGHVEMIYAETVREYDDFTITLGMHPDIIHSPAARDRGKVIGFYGVAFMRNSQHHIPRYMSEREVLDHALRYSRDYQRAIKDNDQSAPWIRNFEAMAQKTLILQVGKLAPKCTEDATFNRALMLEEGSIDVKATPVQGSSPAPEAPYELSGPTETGNAEQLRESAMAAKEKATAPKAAPTPKAATPPSRQPAKAAPEPKKQPDPDQPCEMCGGSGLPTGCLACGVVCEASADENAPAAPQDDLPTFTEDGEEYWDVEAMDKNQLARVIELESLDSIIDMKRFFNPKIKIETLRQMVVDALNAGNDDDSGGADEQPEPENLSLI